MMVRILRAVVPPRPDAWVFGVKNTCRECKTQWTIESSDDQVGGWRYITGRLREPRYENHGNGPVLTSQYIVKTYSGEMGLSGEYVSSRCPNCGAYCFARRPEGE